MASADATLLSLLREGSKCAICLDQLRIPIVLTCVHSFCQKCLEIYQEEKCTSEKIICPLCQEVTPLTDAGLSDLKHDFRTWTLKESLQKVKGRLQQKNKVGSGCEVCGDVYSEVASSYVSCSECQQTMCVQCGNMHTKMRIAQHHTLTAVSSSSASETKERLDNDNSRDKYVFCKKHEDKAVDLFCTFCLIPVCQECSIDHRSQDNHGCVPIDDFAPTMKEELQSRLTRTAQVRERNEEMLSKIGNVEGFVNNKRNFLNNRIESEINRCTHRVKSDLTAINEKFFKYQNLSLGKLKQKVEEREMCIEKCHLKTKEALDESENYRLAATYKELRISLDHILSVTTDQSKLNEISKAVHLLRFQLINDEPLIASLLSTNIQRRNIEIKCADGPWAVTFTRDGRVAVLASFHGAEESVTKFSYFEKDYKDRYQGKSQYFYNPCTYSAIKQTTSNFEVASKFGIEIKVGQVRLRDSPLASLSDLRFVLNTQITGSYADDAAYYVPNLTGHITCIVTDRKDNVYCTVKSCKCIYIVRADGSPTKYIPTGDLTPQSIAVCPRNPDQIVFTHDSSKVSVTDSCGKLLRTITRPDWRNVAIRCDNERLLYVLWKDEAGLRTLQRFHLNGDLFDTLFEKESHRCSDLLFDVSPDGTAAVVTSRKEPLNISLNIVTLVSATGEFTG